MDQQTNKAIRDYIQGNSSYYEGVALFFQLSNNRALKNTFNKGESKRNIEQLKYQLGKFYDDTLPEEEAPEEEKVTREETTTPQAPVYLPTETPQSTGSFSEQLKKLYRLRGHLHGQLHSASTDEERLELMRQLDHAQTAINRQHYAIEEVESGKATPSSLRQVLSEEENRVIYNLRKFIQVNKAKAAKNPDHELLPLWKEKIATKQDELNRILNA